MTAFDDRKTAAEAKFTHDQGVWVWYGKSKSLI